MKPIEFEGQTMLLQPPQGWDNSRDPKVGMLPVRVEMVDGVPTCVSFWKPTQEEMTALADGAFVRLSILSKKHPPVALSVEPAKELP